MAMRRFSLALLSAVALVLGSTPPASAQQYQLPRACDLITEAEAQAALGEPISKTVAELDPAINQALHKSDCAYFGSGNNQVELIVQWSPSPDLAQISWPPDVNP